MKLKDKVAIIAGGTKGIGLGIALEFVKEGASVVVGGTTDKNGEAAVLEIEAAGGNGLFVNCDVSSLTDLDTIIERTVEDFGRLDIYVANAGINDAEKTHYLDITPEQYDRIMNVNLKGMFFGGQKAARQMIAQGEGGVIINMSSVNAYLALDSQFVYTVSKGGVDTDLMRRVGSDKQLMDTILSRTPIGRIGTPQECGRLAVFLASEDSNFIFGQSIFIDGGRGFQAYPTPGYSTVTDEDYERLQNL
jgi:NAD(P)-dependent dehydrogenase (short-subunit alcohol dehydrogenase family)